MSQSNKNSTLFKNLYTIQNLHFEEPESKGETEQQDSNPQSHYTECQTNDQSYNVITGECDDTSHGP